MVTEQNESLDCCGGPAPAGSDACCADAAKAKAAGDQNCGCDESASGNEPEKLANCC